MNIPKYFRLLLFINENGTKNDKSPLTYSLRKVYVDLQVHHPLTSNLKSTKSQKPKTSLNSEKSRLAMNLT